MKIKSSPNKETFQLRKGFEFKGKKKSLTVRAGTIAKLKEKAKYGTIHSKGKKSNGKATAKVAQGLSKTETASKQDSPGRTTGEKKPTTDKSVFSKKKTRQQSSKKQTPKSKGGSASSFVARAGKKQLFDLSASILDQEDDLEGLNDFKGVIDKNRVVYKAAKGTHGFVTKNQKFFQGVTADKITDLRFSGKNLSKPATETVKKRSFKRSARQVSRSAKESFIKSLSKAVNSVATRSPIGWIAAAIVIIVIFISGLLLMSGNQSSSASGTGSVYVEHWDGPDAYHSSLLAQRYGITAEQIDSFIKSEGYTNVDERATGKEFLRLQSISGIDVRMLVAFAQMESSFGTAGVAQQFPKANIFGYGAFDNDPNQGASWDNTRAVNEFRSTQIDSFGNSTIAIMDQRAKGYHDNTLKPGEYVYWTQLDAGKPRAAIAEKLDKWIDDHGGTPEPPGGYGTIGGSGGGAGLTVLDKLLGQAVSGEFGGDSGQCYAVTAYYAHSITPEIILRNGIAASNIGSDYNWKGWGWTVVSNPTYQHLKAGDIINFKAGANMGSWVADRNYGHTGVVGKVLGNNQFLLYDQNPGPLKTWVVTFVPGTIASVIHPPK